MAPPRRYIIRLDVEVRDQDEAARPGEPATVVARCDQFSREVRGHSDAEALCNVLRLGLRDGWVTEVQIAAIVSGALRTRRKARVGR